MRKKSIFPYLMKKVRRRLPALLVMSLANVGSALFGVFFALGTRNVINSAVAGSKEDFLRACLCQAGIILGILGCVTLYRFLHDRLAADLDRDWKQDLLYGLLTGDYAEVSVYHSGELINRLNNDVRLVNDGLLATLPGLLSMITRLGAVIAVLCALESRFTLLLLGFGLLMVLITGLARRKLKALHKAVSTSEGKVSGFLQETLEKLMLVQAMDVQQEVERRADQLLEERYTLQRKRRAVSLLANTGVSTMSRVSGFAALVWCAFHVLQGTMTVGDLTAITQLVSQLQGPLVNLSGFYPKYIAMTAACERLMEIDMLRRQEPEEAPASEMLYETMQSLGAQDLTFSYGKDQEQVLKPSTFRLPKGSFVAVTGPSGGGKSTLLKLMLGIFHPRSGKLYLEDGEGQCRTLDRTTRRLFAYVPQGNLLFSGTLRDNLILTRPQADEEEIQQAIYVSCMDRFLHQLPDGLDTMLGENAHGLSEGQAQRLSIARAVLGQAPILLLDECTSALDAETEQLVLQRISELPGKTCIAVTHRPAALALAQWQLAVEDGVIRCNKREPNTQLPKRGGDHGTP